MPMRRFFAWYAVLLGIVAPLGFASAGSPSGADWFQLLASPFTGGDNTGDGGTGLAADLNYYYVGQSFTATMQINVGTPAGSNAANIWIDYATTTVSSSNIATGSFFPNWSNQNILTDIGRVRSTGYRTSGYSTGLGTFGTVQFQALRPTAANYGTSASTTLNINEGTIGATTESNIANDGTDLLDDEEDFTMFIWADRRKPFGEANTPPNAATAVVIDQDFLFRLFDTRDGEGGSTSTAHTAGGVGTGVNTTRPPGAITFNDGGGAVSYVGYDTYSCSGTWSTNICNVTVNPPSPSGISGDTRNWKYATTYTVTVSGFRDNASSSQDQLGDPNGPNTMDTKIWTFTTEADTVKPQVTFESPTRSSSGNATNTNLIIDVQDRKTYPSGPSGSGVVTTTCSFNVSSPSFTLATFTSASAEVTATPIDYGVRYTINPATNFGQNETVTVSAYNCADVAGNVMVTDTWTFGTSDTNPPFVINRFPSEDGIASSTTNVIFTIKDLETSIDLANTVIYVNGVYYTNAGGAGQVTTNGTRITFTTSSNFNGGNYGGDTTAVSGAANEKTFSLDPQAAFGAGEAVAVLIYSRDASGNLMERVVYAFGVDGASCSGSCPSGASFCGSNTTFSGGQCVGTGGGSGTATGGGGGVAHTVIAINEPTVNVAQIDEQSVVVTWTSTVPGSGRVVYDVVSPTKMEGPYLGYRFSTAEEIRNGLVHSVVVPRLAPGQLYFFRPITKANGIEVYGPEIKMAPRFKTEVLREEIITEKTRTETITKVVTTTVPLVCPTPAASTPRPALSRPTRPATPAATVPRPVTPTAPPSLVPGAVLPGGAGENVPVPTRTGGTEAPASRLRIDRIQRNGDALLIRGRGVPGSLIRLEVF